MYPPKYFSVSDPQELKRFIRANAFGQLVANVNGRPQVSHVPFLLAQDDNRLLCHLARQNSQLESIESQQVLVVFNGPHAYISPRWYASPGVPTWNYQAVHIYGTVRLFTDEQRLQELVDNLSDKYESSAENPWQPDYSPKLLSAIIGVEIEIEEIQGTYKLSQNRSAQDRRQVVEALHAEGETAMAKAIDDWSSP